MQEGARKFLGGAEEEEGVRGLDDIKVVGGKGRKADGWMGR